MNKFVKMVKDTDSRDVLARERATNKNSYAPKNRENQDDTSGQFNQNELIQSVRKTITHQ